MSSILSHPAVPLAIGLGLGFRKIPPRLLIVGVVASILPDLDVLAFRVGIAYSHPFGHRGITHSLTFAIALALIVSLFAVRLRASRTTTFWFVFVATASHGLLDMFTNGGLGVAYFWPYTTHRFFFPMQAIDVSPLNLQRFFSHAGSKVLQSELAWVWLPCMAAGMMAYLARRK